MFISPKEILDIILMTLVVGFIFKDTFKAPQGHKDVLEKYLSKSSFAWHDFWFAAMVTAPGIILHEFGHKFVALSMGLSATFNASYTWLGIALILKLLSFPFLIFVPAYVSISGDATIIERVLTAFSGPLVNLLLFAGAFFLLKFKKFKGAKMQFWVLTKNINLFLFGFNMIPIPGFDGFTVFSGLWKMFFG